MFTLQNPPVWDVAPIRHTSSVSCFLRKETDFQKNANVVNITTRLSAPVSLSCAAWQLCFFLIFFMQTLRFQVQVVLSVDVFGHKQVTSLLLWSKLLSQPRVQLSLRLAAVSHRNISLPETTDVYQRWLVVGKRSAMQGCALHTNPPSEQ